jgi:hypothetical protein
MKIVHLIVKIDIAFNAVLGSTDGGQLLIEWQSENAAAEVVECHAATVATLTRHYLWRDNYPACYDGVHISPALTEPLAILRIMVMACRVASRL